MYIIINFKNRIKIESEVYAEDTYVMTHDFQLP